jgi:phage baseplate assembly protein W
VQLDFPYHLDGRRRTATTDATDHARDLIEQVLFTAPGERVNRPDFGCGLHRLVFEPNGPELAAATQMLVHGALQQTLADRLTVIDVTVEAEDAALRIAVTYALHGSREARRDVFTPPRGADAGGGVP